MSVIAGQPLAGKKVADKEIIRQFVRTMAEIAENIKDAKEDLKSVVTSLEEVISIDEQIKQLKEERKEIIESSEVVRSYKEKLEELVDDKDDVIFQAKQDGVPKNEVDAAIRCLKSDTDITTVQEIYIQIADLID